MTVSPVVAVSEFDAVHRGHQRLVSAAIQLAAMSRSEAVGVVLHDLGHANVTSISDRCDSLLKSGLAAVHVLRFDDGDKDVEGAEIAARLIATRLAPSAVVMACSAESSTSSPSLARQFVRHDVHVVLEPRECDRSGSPITSERVRHAIADGDLETTGALLGRHLRLKGTVIHGAALGRTLGFPTANVRLDPSIMTPRLGVYAGVAQCRDGARVPAAINVGIRPTVTETGVVSVEAHLLDFDGDLYDQQLALTFVHRLRDEQRFAGIAELMAQLADDVANVRRHLSLT